MRVNAQLYITTRYTFNYETMYVKSTFYFNLQFDPLPFSCMMENKTNSHLVIFIICLFIVTLWLFWAMSPEVYLSSPWCGIVQDTQAVPITEASLLVLHARHWYMRPRLYSSIRKTVDINMMGRGDGSHDSWMRNLTC